MSLSIYVKPRTLNNSRNKIFSQLTSKKQILKILQQFQKSVSNIPPVFLDLHKTYIFKLPFTFNHQLHRDAMEFQNTVNRLASREYPCAYVFIPIVLENSYEMYYSHYPWTGNFFRALAS